MILRTTWQSQHQAVTNSKPCVTIDCISDKGENAVVNIVGAGGFAREVLNHYLHKFNPLKNFEPSCPWGVNFYVEPEYTLDAINTLNQKKQGFAGHEKMAFCVRALDNTFKIGHAFIGTGNPCLKEKLSKHVIHPTALDCSALNYNQTTSEGTIICPGVMITSNVMLGKMVTLNLNVTVGHDVLIDDYTTVNPGVHISGNVRIGKHCLIGTGAVIKEGITIADGTIIGAGAVVVKNILEPNHVHFGNPAVQKWLA